jgi:flagellar biosynthetic protein FliR
MLFDLPNWFAVFARAGAFMAVFPLTSAQNVPVQIRLAMGIMAAFLVGPTLPASHLEALPFWGLMRFIAGEVLVGLILGFVCRMIFYAVEMAGTLLATEMGLMLSTSFNPLGQSVISAPGLLLYWLSMMILFSLDLHHWLVAAFVRTYTVLPAGTLGPGRALLFDVVGRTGQTFVIALQISAPLLAVSFLVTIIFAILGRAVPTMNVFTENFSVRLLAGLFVLGLTCNFMAQHISNYLRRLPEDCVTAARLLAG